MRYKYRHACRYVCMGACRHAGIAWHWMFKRVSCHGIGMYGICGMYGM